MRRFFQIICICVLSSYAYSQDGSSIDFVIKNLGINVDGHFETFSIIATFNSNEQLTDVSATIDVASIKTGIDNRDEHLLKEDYFNLNAYKNIRLQSTSISKTTANTYTITAELTIKGITKTLSIPVTVERQNDRYNISSFFEINRRDFDVGGGSFVMGKTVKINVTHYQTIE